MTASYITSAANTIASALLTNSRDLGLAAAVRLADQQMLLSPEVAAEIADAAWDVCVAQLELELIDLTRAADDEVAGEMRAGMLLAVRYMHASLRRVRSSRARRVTPEVAAVIRAGRAIEAGIEPAGGAS